MLELHNIPKVVWIVFKISVSSVVGPAERTSTEIVLGVLCPNVFITLDKPHFACKVTGRGFL